MSQVTVPPTRALFTQPCQSYMGVLVDVGYLACDVYALGITLAYLESEFFHTPKAQSFVTDHCLQQDLKAMLIFANKCAEDLHLALSSALPLKSLPLVWSLEAVQTWHTTASTCIANYKHMAFDFLIKDCVCQHEHSEP